ncbi:MAG: DUF1385 domain-containing protein [Chloroflexi bacterium]|nr:DUF1385 domain-containing protein [Chloroflexota bacterium]
MSEQARPFYYGGQAVYEGVMIRGRKSLATAVRTQAGAVAVESRPLNPIFTGRLRQTPFVRGVIVLLETLLLGTQALMRSADMVLSEEEEIPQGLVWGTVVLGLGLGVALFIVAPLVIARYVIFPYTSPLVGNVLEGLLRIAMFLAYLKATRLLPDIRRIFAYHGAEHKVINAFEHGEPLGVEPAKRYPTAHLRCGTSFLLIVLVVAIAVYALVGRPTLWLMLLSRLVFLPVIVAIAYEAIRFSADHNRSPYIRALLRPGLALQSMTTAEPTDAQIEVALAAMMKVLEDDGVAVGRMQYAPTVETQNPG